MTLYKTSSLLLTRLERSAQLPSVDRELIGKLQITMRSCKSHEDVIRQGDQQTHYCFVYRGILACHKIAENYRRQILSFHVRGDLPSLDCLHLQKASHTLSTIGPAVVGLITHGSMLALIASSPTIVRALWRETAIEGSISREWGSNMAGRDAVARVAHLICEIVERSRAAGIALGHEFEFPCTQQDIADACGLSNVHVNRVVQALRSQRIIEWRAKKLRIIEWVKLKETAGFSSDYLHLSERTEEIHRPSANLTPSFTLDSADNFVS